MTKNQKYHVHTGDDGAWTVWQGRYGIAWKVVCHCNNRGDAEIIAKALTAGEPVNVFLAANGLAYRPTVLTPPADTEDEASSREVGNWFDMRG